MPLRVKAAAAAPALLSLTLLTVPAAAQVRIGLAAPLTGPDAGFGGGMRAGVEQAVADINRAGGIVGQKIQLVVQDDAGDPKQAAEAARRLAAAGVRLVVGPLDSGATAAALPIFEEAGLLAVTPGATWASLTARGAGRLFRLAGNDAQQGAVAGAWLAETFQGRPVAILNDKTGFGRSLAEDAARVLRSRGGREALFEGINRGDKDFPALIGRMRAAGVEAVYFGGLAPEAAMLVRALREAGLQAPLVASDGILDKDFAQLAGPGAEGTLMTLAPDPPRLPETKGAKGARTPEDEMFAAPAYAAIEVIRQGIEGARSTDPAKVAAFLHAGRPLRTVVGEVAFDGKGDLTRSPYRLHVWHRTPDGRIDYAGNAVPR
ncbi:branched-chain amino acid ABC transporter substrate-binding protein [Methylobacterium organophilum]|uniref:Leucine-, isoleucine-, valine-, threonine-, and alanine-binding protein n=1 Tax=Methylobacterium organophilum TaxID=410 RepID=A0ABQ4T9I8_METOR|nr:branched-chain amino acid ABC transporter substrate-binding protein [Methylobacterium organophilum]GJE28263.1 Leucine-, isoleucine-, valine-, threonine-, and alanine-binding protein [Methylobacterium organophilum]